jgi:LEA14-like dessication related protein
MNQRYFLWVMIAVCSLLFSACNNSKIKQAIQNQKPTVTITQVRIIDINFEEVTLGFDTRIDNPNPVDISLAGIDYDLHLQGNSFLKGITRQPVTIKASAKSAVELPLTIGFEKLKSSYAAIKDKPSVDYLLNLNLLIDVPIIGQYSHALKQEGSLPVPKKPSIDLADIRVNRMSFTGADVDVSFNINNPNPYSAVLDQLNYKLNINGKEWASGTSEEPGTIEANGNSIINIPVSLKFSQLGMELYKLLSSSSNINYGLSGDLKAHVPEIAVGKFYLPIDQKGTFKLSR